MASKVALSVILPAYNEAGYLEQALQVLLAGLRGCPWPHEVLVVQNGSTDRTSEIAHAFGPPVRVLDLPSADYGEALRAGLLAAQGDMAVCCDVDWVDMGFAHQALELIAQGSVEVVLGSKRLPASVDQRPWFRRLATGTFNWLLRVCLGMPVSDTHGIKALDLSACRSLAEQCETRAATFDTELVLRASRAGLVIRELPVEVNEVRPARVHLWRRVPVALVGLVRLWLILRKRYGLVMELAR